MMEILATGNSIAVLAELVDALDSGSSVRKDFRVRFSFLVAGVRRLSPLINQLGERSRTPTSATANLLKHPV
jgi:hypothetical protein